MCGSGFVRAFARRQRRAGEAEHCCAQCEGREEKPEALPAARATADVAVRLVQPQLHAERATPCKAIGGDGHGADAARTASDNASPSRLRGGEHPCSSHPSPSPAGPCARSEGTRETSATEGEGERPYHRAASGGEREHHEVDVVVIDAEACTREGTQVKRASDALAPPSLARTTTAGCCCHTRIQSSHTKRNATRPLLRLRIRPPHAVQPPSPPHCVCHRLPRPSSCTRARAPVSRKARDLHR